jgi:hypothetical protein
MRKAGLAVCAGTLLLLAACGGDDYHAPSSDSGGTGGGGTTTPPASVVDSFLTAVLKFVGASSDTTEPSSTDSLVATAPENTEPTAVNQ